VSDVVPDVGRHAVLVDAGYLYASVGQLVLGRTSRREFRVATEPLIGALLARADRTTPGQLLRMYWYDAARDRVPTVEQRQIAALPNVKVRLGHLNSAGQQKGVDAQLRQDLELLARHRAVSDVVLIAGDEDMVPAVEAAQAYGVRVHVWGVEPPYGVNQAERLVWEADTVEQLDAEFCRPYVEVEPAAVEAAAVAAAVEAAIEPGPREDKPAVPTPADVFAARKLAAPPPKPVGAAPVVPALPDRPGPERPEMEQIGARIAARWLLTRGRENVADLLPGPVLPTVIDKELLVEAEEEISRSLRPYEEARRALRDGFWAKLHEDFGIQPASVPPHPSPDHHPATQPPPPIHPAPPASAPSGPAVPAASGPAVPAASGPAVPAASGPAAPAASGPAAAAPSGTAAEGQSGSAAPGYPRTAAPGHPGSSAQGDPSRGAQGDSGGVAPSHSGTAAPDHPGSSAQGDPSRGAPGDSGGVAPGHSGTAAPDHPGIAGQGHHPGTAQGDPGTAAQGDPGAAHQGYSGPASVHSAPLPSERSGTSAEVHSGSAAPAGAGPAPPAPGGALYPYPGQPAAANGDGDRPVRPAAGDAAGHDAKAHQPATRSTPAHT
jgi:uncharacterized LabA/DUF88 family protein